MKLISRKLEKKNLELINRSDYASDLMFLKDVIFVKCLVYVYSLSILVLIPGILYGIFIENYWVVFWDVLTYLMVLFLTYPSCINLIIRKWIFIIAIYLLGFQLLMQLGMDGAGILFWIIGNISCSLLFKKTQLIFVVLANAIVFSIIAVLIYIGNLPETFSSSLSLDDWVLISIHNMYLSVIISSVLNELLNILERVLVKEKKLQDSILKSAIKTKQSIQLFETKNKELEQLSFFSAKALKLPLNNVEHGIQHLNKQVKNTINDKADSYLHFASLGVVRMKELISGMDQLSKIDQYFVYVETVDMDVTINDVFNRYKSTNPNMKLTFQSENKIIQVDRHLITNLIEIIIDNCVMFRNKKNTLIVEVKIAAELKSNWLISISDNGIGIERKHFERIFQLYQRLHKQLDIPGNGIGLALAKRIVNKLNGRIWVDSIINQGTTFIISLPQKQTDELD